jgi:hypothetical protein
VAGVRPAVNQTIRGVLDRRLELVRARLDRAVERGELQPVDPVFFAQMVSGPVQFARLYGGATFERSEWLPNDGPEAQLHEASRRLF